MGVQKNSFETAFWGGRLLPLGKSSRTLRPRGGRKAHAKEGLWSQQFSGGVSEANGRELGCDMRARVAACLLVLSHTVAAADKPTLAAAKVAAHESATACEHRTADGLRHHIALTAAGVPVEEASGSSSISVHRTLVSGL